MLTNGHRRTTLALRPSSADAGKYLPWPRVRTQSSTVVNGGSHEDRRWPCCAFPGTSLSKPFSLFSSEYLNSLKHTSDNNNNLIYQVM
ncbi:hypothetical protein GWI33_000682 [Rhynchophorus ferrugineus]|uniref:Uncharacterized protein n=1 Tax=Rhynchophorus ferrugineus TaxID=354439 RepID=A0A834MH71_RHYFE|nr:hypothetical protein GWI33_000682 [Rhynchophorus ferrugineus]